MKKEHFGIPSRKALRTIRFFALLIVILAVAGLMTGCNSGQTETLISTDPAGAAIVMDGTTVGHTPAKVPVKTATTIEVHLDGYKPQTATLMPGGDTKLVLKLEPMTVEKAETHVSAPAFEGLRSLKQKYGSGEINRNEYDQRVRRAKTHYANAVRSLKSRYSKGEINRSDYQQRLMQLKSQLNS